MTTEFTIEGPREIPYYQGRGGRTITDEDVIRFWEANADITNRRGCYVFGIRAGRGLTPAYVGKATRSFKQEVFAHHKLTRYQQFLSDYQKGTPVMFFVVAPVKRGTPNGIHIAELEQFLIQTGQAANPHLLNVRGTRAEEWSISGVHRSGRGKPSNGARAFRRLMNIEEPSAMDKAVDEVLRKSPVSKLRRRSRP